jgi:hypothetical protein
MMNSPTLTTGAVVTTLLAHRGDWVRRHAETIELRPDCSARRRVTVEFELPGIAWAAVPRGSPVLVPLGMRPKDDAGDDVGAHDEEGARVAVLPDTWSAEIATAGLAALAQVAGADAEDVDLLRLAWTVADGAPAEAREALDTMARGETEATRRAWAHAPFRAAAETFAERRLLLVALREADRERALTYFYDERPEILPARGAGRLSRWLGWDGLRLRLPVLHARDSGRYSFEAELDGDECDSDLDEARGSATVRARAPGAASVRLGPVAALVAALFLSAGWAAAPRLDDGSSPLLLALALPAVLAAYLAARPERASPAGLVRGPRTLLWVLAGVTLAGEALLSSGASTAVLRVGSGVAAAVAWVVAALLVETRRRALGQRPAWRPADAGPPEPARDTRRANATRVALLACAMAAGLMIVALAGVAARDGTGGAHALLWAGLLVIFVPGVLHAWSAPPRGEAVFGAILTGVSLYLVKVLNSPLHFTLHDEFSTLRTTVDIERHGTLFQANPLIEVHPFYPALELVTSAVSSVTGLSIFVSALVVIGVLRVALMAALFLLFERAASTRVAGLAAVLYACNPNFVLFDSQWAYESFALPLALVVLAMAAQGRRAALLAIPIVMTLCVAHPLTSVALTAFLLVWAACDLWTARRTRGRARRELWLLALVGAACMAIWALLVARNVGGYLGPVLGKAGHGLVDLLLGESGPKRIFGGAGVPDVPLVERLVGMGSVLLALTAVALGAWIVWRRFNPLAGALTAAALVYPVSLPLRLTESGTEISNRASEFVFVGVALLAALVLTERSGRRLAMPLAAALAGVALLGGLVVGTARSARLPGDYRVVADESSIEPEGRAAAAWARTELGPGNRIFTDRINSLLMGSLGLQEPLVGAIDGRPVPRLLTAPDVDDDVRYVVAHDAVGYLVADRRLTTALPEVGVYFDREEPGAYRHARPIEPRALAKWDAVCPVGRAFDSGNLVVYDTRWMSLRGVCDVGRPQEDGG